jgi:hypothetical protein
MVALGEEYTTSVGSPDPVKKNEKVRVGSFCLLPFRLPLLLLLLCQDPQFVDLRKTNR